MAWASGLSVVGGAKTANLVELYVFGSTDAGKNLVGGTTYTATLTGNAAYGSDAIGTYVGTADDSGDGLTVARTAGTGSVTDVWMIVFSMTASVVAYDRPFLKDTFCEFATNGTILQVGGNVLYSTAINKSVVPTDTEFAMLWDAGTGKFYYTGGSTPAESLPAQNVSTGSIGTLYVCRSTGGNSMPNMRARAFARWSSSSGLADSDLQSIVDNPKQLVGIGGAASGDSQRLARGTNRGIARGIYRRAADWIRTPSGLLVPA